MRNSVRQLSGRLILLSFLACASGLGAQTTVSTVVAHRFHHDVWRLEDGLPNAPVTSLQQTPDGYLWIGGGLDISRFDGVRFKMMIRRDSVRLAGRPSFHQAHLRFVDAKGRLWVTYEGGHLVSYDNGRITSIPSRDTTLQYGPETPVARKQGGMWAVFRDQLYLWDGQGYRPANVAGLPLHRTFSLASDTSGILYVGFRTGEVYRTDGTTAQRIELPMATGNVADGIEQIIPTRDGGLWVQSARELVRVNHGVAKPVVLSDSNTVYSIMASDGANGLWVAPTMGGIWHLDANGTVIDHIDPSSLASPQVWAMLVDREGSLWVGTNQGLERFRRTPFVAVDIATGISEAAEPGVVWSDPSTFWTVGPDGRVRRVSLDQPLDSLIGVRPGHASVTMSPKRYPVVRSLATTRNDGVWIGASSGRVDYWTPKTGEIRTMNGLDSVSSVHQVLETRRGDVWTITSRGLFKLDGRTFHRFVPTNGARVPLPTTWGFGRLYEDREGRIWLGGGILIRIENDSIVRFDNSNGLAGYPVRAIHESRDGIVWASSGFGALTRIVGNRAVPVPLDSTRTGQIVTNIAEDSAGFLWLAGNTGVERISLSALNAVADGKARTATGIRFTTLDGIPNEASAVMQTGVYTAPNGTLWFAFDRSLAAVDPERLASNSVAPPVRVEDVRVDEHTFSPDSLGKGVEPGSYRLELHFTGTSLLLPSRMRFRYRLEGAENTWTETSGLVRSATYTRLAPGGYRFRVQAANNDGVWNTEGAELAFRVLPAWYQTWWSRAGALLLLIGTAAGVAWTAARIRQDRRAARMHAMMAERQRMAREIHDTLLQGFTGITLQLQALRAQVVRAPAQADESLDRLLRIADVTLASARKAVWEMRPPDLDHNDLAEALGTALQRTSDGTPELRYRVTGVPRRLAPETEVAMLRIAIEAAANAVKHARAKALDVELAFGRRDVALNVRDDGCGFDVEPTFAALGSRFGLAGMRERAAEVGARVEISSLPGRGTTVSVVARAPM